MNYSDLKEIIARITDKMNQTPEPACIWGDCDCIDCEDVHTYYGITEEG